MNKEFEDVRVFNKTFGRDVPDKPVLLSYEVAEKRYEWILEEINEFMVAAIERDIVEMADAIIDIIYHALGVLTEMGIQPDPLFKIVQNANMSKLWPDGKSHCNKWGKLIKPSGWKDPHNKLAEAISLMYDDNSIDSLKEDYSLNYQYEEVRKLRQTFELPISDVPILLSLESAREKCFWILEEINEFMVAAENCDIVEMADAMIDTIYLCLATLAQMGIQPEELFEIVQNSNMNKLWPDGKPHYNETGKIIKPNGWEDPHKKLALTIKKMQTKNRL